jgi:hypothetical protein
MMMRKVPTFIIISELIVTAYGEVDSKPKTIPKQKDQSNSNGSSKNEERKQVGYDDLEDGKSEIKIFF